MDPTLPEQWTDGGLPAVSYVAAAVQNETVTREMIDFACPGWNKNKAEDFRAGDVQA